MKENAPNIQIHIDRLILEGVPFNSHQAARMQKSLQSELARLLANNRGRAWQSSAVPTLPGAAVSVPGGASPDAYGRVIAKSVFAQLAPVPGNRS